MRSRVLHSLTVVILTVIGMALLPFGVRLAQAAAVTISGDVSLSGSVIQVVAQVRGPASSLSGQGSDTPRTPPAGSNPGFCQFPLTGSVSGSLVTLSGTVTISSNPSFIGAPVTINADAGTGSIIFNFAGFVFTGTGRVVIR